MVTINHNSQIYKGIHMVCWHYAIAYKFCMLYYRLNSIKDSNQDKLHSSKTGVTSEVDHYQ